MKTIKKVSTSEHSRMVEHARKLVELRQTAKWEICEIALKLCTIAEKKGRVPPDSYTITKFAEDIGMNRKTLSCWLLDYQTVYSKLNLPSVTTLEESGKQHSAITRTRMELFNFESGSKAEQLNSVSDEVVRKTYEKNYNEDPLMHRLDTFIKYVRHQKYTFENEKFLARHQLKIEHFRQELKELMTIVNKL